MAATIIDKSPAAAAASSHDDDDLKKKKEEEQGVVLVREMVSLSDQSTSSSSPPPHEIQRDSSSTVPTTTSRTTDAAGSTLLLLQQHHQVVVLVAEEETVVDVDLMKKGGVSYSGKPHLLVHNKKVDKNCRICHLSLEEEELKTIINDDDAAAAGVRGGGVGVPIIIELGCSCKDDLAAAHKHCAEAWFKIKGNLICEICGATARNLVGANETQLLMEQCNETNDDDAAATTTATAGRPAVAGAGTQNFWHGHRLLNLVLACVVFGFIISWLFHFNMPS